MGVWSFWRWRIAQKSCRFALHLMRLTPQDGASSCRSFHGKKTADADGYRGTAAERASGFSRYQVEPQTQSRSIHEHGYNGRPEDELAREWIAENPERIREWLDGVTAVDGESEFEAVKAEYDL